MDLNNVVITEITNFRVVSENEVDNVPEYLTETQKQNNGNSIETIEAKENQRSKRRNMVFNNLKQVSCHVDANEDGTFCVVNTYKDDDEKIVEQKYQRVKIDIFHGIQMFKTISPFPRINNIEVLENEKGELFTTEIKD